MRLNEQELDRNNSETTNGQEGAAEIKISENLQSGDAAISNLGGVDIEIPSDTGMQVSTDGKIQKTRNNGKEAEAPRYLPILEYLAFG